MYKKNKSLIWSIVALIILNIGSLGLLWYKQVARPNQPPPPLGQQVNPERFLEMELQLTDDQANAFHELRQKHRQETRNIREDIHRLSRDIVDELFKPQPDTARVIILSEEIGRKQAMFERTLYYHFNDLKQVFGPDRQEKLRLLLFEILDKTQSPTPPPRLGDNPDRQSPPRPGDNSDRQPPPRPEDNPDTRPPLGG